MLIVSVIEALKVFTQIYALTGGGPGGATTTIGFFLYQNLPILPLGLASAVAVLMFILVMAAPCCRARWRGIGCITMDEARAKPSRRIAGPLCY